MREHGRRIDKHYTELVKAVEWTLTLTPAEVRACQKRER